MCEHQSESDFAEFDKSTETSSLPFSQGTHVHFMDKSSRILVVEGAEIAECSIPITNYIRMLATLDIPALSLIEGRRHLYLQVL
jgi:hypothetical protein